MKHIFLTTIMTFVAIVAFAQTYSLTDMSDETFAAGGDTQWSFGKYEYATGNYTAFTQYGDSSLCNYLDIYNPERCMVERITEIDGVEPNGVNTWASNRRYAWYDHKFENPNSDQFIKFIYMSENFETYANPRFAGVVSFTIPADGFYRFSGRVVREDCTTMPALQLIPRYRLDATDRVPQEVSLGLAYDFGDKGGDLNDGITSWNLASGAPQRYIPQTPVDFSFVIEGKAGDIVSFETSAYKNYASASTARECWGRCFFKALNVTELEEDVARADESFIDIFDMDAVDDFEAFLENYEIQFGDLPIGDGFGCFPKQAAEEFQSLIDEIAEALSKGNVVAMNVNSYKKMLEDGWAKLMSMQQNTDLTIDGNYVLFTDIEGISTNDMTVNENTPWGYYAHVVVSGNYEKFASFTTTKAGIEGWCRNNGEWLYINTDGSVHPTNDRCPSFLFTAPEDGVYRVGVSACRPNPNTSVENPLYIRSHYIADGETLNCSTNQEIISVQYGSVANDGMKGKAPVDLDYFVVLNKGDHFSVEVDCYTSGRNSSAGTLFTRLWVCSQLSDEQAVTLDYAETTGLLIFNPYAAADLTELKAAYDRADALVKEIGEDYGDEDGQYNATKYMALMEQIDAAEQFMAQSNPLQVDADELTRKLNEAIEAMVNARNPYHYALEAGSYSIKIKDTDKFLFQKNLASGGEHYYAAFTNVAGIESDMAKNNTSIEDYGWFFEFEPIEGTNTYYIKNGNGYVCADGYVRKFWEPTEEQLAALAFEILTETKNDNTVTIRRADGKYWNTGFSWSSPYDKVNTSSVPVYAFIISKQNPYGIPGDVNGDGTVDINDVVAIINHIAGTDNYENANVNGDTDAYGNSLVDINDVVTVINIMAE